MNLAIVRRLVMLEAAAATKRAPTDNETLEKQLGRYIPTDMSYYMPQFAPQEIASLCRSAKGKQASQMTVDEMAAYLLTAHADLYPHPQPR